MTLHAVRDDRRPAPVPDGGEKPRTKTRIDGLLGSRRLVVVSNREPYETWKDADGERRYERTTGGLVTALEPVVRECEGVWLAWDPGGDPDDPVSLRVPGDEPRFTLRQVPLTQEQVDGYYYGFANRALWPLFHYFMGRCHFDEDEWRHYIEVNERFADAVLEATEPDDLIWIHDYHFCLLPRLIRERRPESRIAFFLHIPFPAEEVFRIFPWRRQLLRGLLGADLVGFQVRSYAEHFLESCHRLLGTELDLDSGAVSWDGREIEAADFPIGIDVDEFERIARRPEIRERAKEIRASLGAETMIFGVDRLDYSKGIPARLSAVDCLLDEHPEHRKKVSFVQVASPSRTNIEEYQDLKREIDEMVGRINGRYGDSAWQPIRYNTRGVGREELVAHYLAADVALVTPLRDGMNLVAKEYCAAKGYDSGVLILSEFTGAAQELGSDVLAVNPFAVREVAGALHQALTMTEEERCQRMGSLREKIRRSDISRWLEDVLRHFAGGEPGRPMDGDRERWRS